MNEKLVMKAEGHEFEIGELVRLRSDLPEAIMAAIPKQIELGKHYRIYFKRDGDRKGIVFVGPQTVQPETVLKYDPDDIENARKHPDVVPVADSFFEKLPDVLHFPWKR